ncbi:hypothetical protein M8J75_002298 [Diaphorina citri]|nr:hypothetical protein M8J75_002298 [Diaphorina citri]
MGRLYVVLFDSARVILMIQDEHTQRPLHVLDSNLCNSPITISYIWVSTHYSVLSMELYLEAYYRNDPVKYEIDDYTPSEDVLSCPANRQMDILTGLKS